MVSEMSVAFSISFANCMNVFVWCLHCQWPSGSMFISALYVVERFGAHFPGRLGGPGGLGGAIVVSGSVFVSYHCVYMVFAFSVALRIGFVSFINDVAWFYISNGPQAKLE